MRISSSRLNRLIVLIYIDVDKSIKKINQLMRISSSRSDKLIILTSIYRQIIKNYYKTKIIKL